MLSPKGKYNLTDKPLPEQAPQSFILRVWQETPFHWRGMIRHVQSDAKRGFTKMDEAVAFVEQRIPAGAPVTKQKRTADTPRPEFDLGWFWQRKFQPVWAGVALLLLLGIGVALSGSGGTVPLVGAAVGGGIPLETILIFSAGVLVGAVIVLLWIQLRRSESGSD